MALGPGSFSDHLRIERLPIAMLPLPERILAAFQYAADGLADARPQDSVPLGALKAESYRDLRRLDSLNQATSAWGIVPLAVEISPTRRASRVSWAARIATPCLTHLGTGSEIWCFCRRSSTRRCRISRRRARRRTTARRGS